MGKRFVQVALPVPFRRCYDYLPAVDGAALPAPGSRVCVPFGGRREQVGVVLGVADQSEVEPARLKAIARVIDAAPLFPPRCLELLRWAAEYYHHPIGEVLFNALPPPLRRGAPAEPPEPSREEAFTPAAAGKDPAALAQLERAPAQQALLQLLQAHPAGLDRPALRRELPHYAAPLKALLEKGLAERTLVDPAGRDAASPPASEVVNLNEQQRAAAAAINAHAGAHQVLALEGVTGSGKTEVYIEAVRRALDNDKQALILVPEIGLTTQFIERLRRRLPADVRVHHSAMSAAEQLRNWLAARDGTAAVIVGARSAVWLPLKSPGLYVVDEEQDSSYKQDSGFLYSARDAAVMRAKLDRAPVVLGSATLSLETLCNVKSGKYSRLRLPARALGGALPAIRILDQRREAGRGALSKTLLNRVAGALAENKQALLFLNRRGYAPVILCRDCGWYAECRHCSIKMTYHKEAGQRLLCHHCGARQDLPPHCPECAAAALVEVGHGTQRLERELAGHFPAARIVRVDRDSTRRKGAMERMIREITRGEVDILVGTQMLAKGHHFPRLALAALVDADAGLLSVDFRAAERMAQLVVQVSGRTGREQDAGVMYVQTHFPGHPLLGALVREGYGRFADLLLAERESAELPPYAHLALLGAEAAQRADAEKFLEDARRLLEDFGADLGVFGPIAAPIEKRRGRYRSQLLIRAGNRVLMRQVMAPWVRMLEDLPAGRRARWRLDIDPQDLL